MGLKVNWFVNQQCNLDKTCLFCHRQQDFAEQGTDEMLRIADQIGSAGVERVTIGGGEPLLRKDLEVIVGQLKDHDLFVGLHTNGTLLEKRLDGLRGLVDLISLPIEGVSDEVNEGMRGVRYWELYDLLLPQVKELGFPVAFKTVATPENVAEIPGIYEKLPEDFDYWRVYQFRPLNNGDLHRERFQILDPVFGEVVERLEELGDDRVQPVSVAEAHRDYVFVQGTGDVLTYSPVEERNLRVGNVFEQPLRDLALGSGQLYKFAADSSPVSGLLASLLRDAPGSVRVRVIYGDSYDDPRLAYYADD